MQVEQSKTLTESRLFQLTPRKPAHSAFVHAGRVPNEPGGDSDIAEIQDYFLPVDFHAAFTFLRLVKTPCDQDALKRDRPSGR